MGEVAVYLFFEGYPVEPGPYLVPVARQIGPSLTHPLALAITSLLSGVTDDETGMGLSSTIPEGTELLGVEVTDGIAAVDLSPEFESGGGSLSMLGRVAQIVYTATQFDGVEGVEFFIEGTRVEVLGGEGLIIDEPQQRSGYTNLLPVIFVEEPYWGASVEGTLAITGSTLSSSEVVSFVIVDSEGEPVDRGEIQPSPASGRAEFAGSANLASISGPGAGSIIVYEVASDGSQSHVLDYPLIFGK